MKKTSIILVFLLAALFISSQYHIVRADDNDSSQQTTSNDDSSQSDDDSEVTSNRPAKTMIVHYQTIDGKTISSDKTVTTTGDSVFMRGDGGDSAVKLIKGYIRYHAYKTDYSYDNLPSSITIQYVKDSMATKQMAKYYMNYLNNYRKKQGLKKLKNSPSLDKKASVRSKELLTDFNHTRPNGTSYNTKNSGYAEVILGIGPYYTGPDNTLNYKYTGEQNAFYLLNEDEIHRDTLLNKWANYGAVSFSLTTTNFVMCGLFSVNK